MTNKPEKFTDAELAELEAALDDAFDDYRSNRRGEQQIKIPVPGSIPQGLTPFSIRTRASYAEDDDETCESDDWDEDDDVPKWFETIPVNFNLKKLRSYFEARKVAFEVYYFEENSDYLTHPMEVDGSTDEGKKYIDSTENLIYREMTRNPLTKSWYEASCLGMIEEIDDFLLGFVAKHPFSAHIFIVPHVGRLGRLVEQYRWKFSHEPAAITGVRVQESAERGGRIRSQVIATSRTPHLAEMDRRVRSGEKVSKVAADIVARDRLEIQPRSLEQSFNRWRRKQK